MNIELTKADLQRFIEEQIRAGNFASPADVIEAGLAQLKLDIEIGELDEATLDAIDQAEAQLDRGERLGVQEVLDRLRRRAGERS